MPSTYAHKSFGREVFAVLPDELQTILCNHLDLYYVGLHGPDILFYYHPFFPNPVNRQGYQLHGKNARTFFRKGLAALRDMSDPEAGLAYMFGFICHFALDSECHGYIEYKIRHSNLTHTELETEFDRMLLEEHELDPIRYCLTSHILPQTVDCTIIARFFPRVKPKQVEWALKSMIYYNRLLQAAIPARRKLLLLILRITGNYKQMHGLLMPDQPRTGCADSNQELQRRMRGAVPVACQLIENFYNAYMEMDVLSQRFQRTFGPDRSELSRYEFGFQTETARSKV